ncbi:hypothetical protein OROMI_013031 [Orobanche minor]
MVFKIRPSQEINKIRDGTLLEAEEILTYRKKHRNGSIWHFCSKLDVPSNVLQKERVARILVFKIRPSQEILKIRDGTHLEAEEILKYRKKPSKWIGLKERVAQILVFKIRPSQEILKIRDVLQKKSVARIMVFKIRPSQEINKIRDGTLLEAEEILTYRKKPRNGSIWHFCSKLDKKRVARILVFEIWPSQEILKIRDGTPLEKKRVARILIFKIWPSQEILKIRDGTPLEAEKILTYRKKPRNGSVWHFSSKLDVPSNVLQKERVARILVFKIRPSQEILKIRDGTHLEAEEILKYRKKPSKWIEINKIRDGTLLEAEEILTYRKKPRNGSIWHFCSKLDVPSNKKRVARILKKRVARILIFKIWPSQEILKIRDGTPLEAEKILTYRKKPRNGSVWHFSSKLDVPSNVLQKERVARILVFKIRPSQEILKIRDGTHLEKSVARIMVFKIRPSQEINKIRDGTLLEAEEILTYRKKHRNGSIWHFCSKLDVPSNVLQKERVARILVFKIRPSQEILKIRDGTHLEAEEILKYRKKPSKWIGLKERVARILVFKIRLSQEILKIRDVARILIFKIWPSQEILKIRDGTPLEAEKILTYRKKPRNGSVWHFSSKLDVPSNVLQKERVARILVFKIRPSQEILKIRDGTHLEKSVARIMVFKIRPSQEINKIRDGTLLEAEEILTYRKKHRNGSIWHFCSKLDVPSNVLQKERVARILVFKIRPSQEILKIRDGTHLEAEEILKYRKKPSKWIGLKERVARILVFKIRPSQEILKIRDGTHLEKSVARIMVFKIRPSQEINKIRDGTLLEAEEILTYRKKPRNGSIWHFCSKLDKKRVARILIFKIWPSQEILKIRDGTPLEAEKILTYRKKPRNGSVWHFSSKLDVPSNVLQKERVARILVFKIRPSQEILKIRDGTHLEAEEILKYRKKPSKWIGLVLFYQVRCS